MSEDKRDQARYIQNLVIVAAEKRGYTDDMRVSNNMPANITLGMLRTFIFPDYLSEIENVLLVLTNPNRR